MTPPQTTDLDDPCQDPFRWLRRQTASLLDEALHADFPSRRAAADALDVPEATLRYWQQRHHRCPAPPAWRDFFESPAGLDFLHGLVLAAHLVLNQSAATGLRPLLSFFLYAGLQPFLACSYGPHQRLASQLRDLILLYDQQQRQRLAPTMPPRLLSLAEDENFHQGQPCLVAIEPVSNFILVETFASQRDACSWNHVTDKALEGLSVTVVQVSSDEAKGILAHTRDGLKAHHSPDLMHLQQDLQRATSLPLRTQVKKAQEHVDLTELAGVQVWVARAEWDEDPPRRQRPDFESPYAQCKAAFRAAKEALARAEEQQQEVKEAIRGLGDDYHPFDGSTGEALTAEEMQERLQGRLKVVQEAAEQAGVGETGQGKIRRVVKRLPQMVATLSWFWLQVRTLAASEGWTEWQQELLRTQVVGWCYWEQASRRGRNAEERARLRALACRLREGLESNAAWQGLTEGQRERMRVLGKEGAGRWVRSSSCVEGRNGYLSLRHHGRRGLTQKELSVLTVLHNYALVRADGTTAAERFFGQKPDDLFSWLLQRLPQLPRPAQPRRKLVP